MSHATVRIVGDSHARVFTKLIQEQMVPEIDVKELVYPGARLGEVLASIKEAHTSNCDFLVITAGANDAYRGEAINVFKNMKSLLMSLRPCKILLGGIPFRQDLPLFHRINEDIFNLNMHFFELSRTMKDVSFLDMTTLTSRYFNLDGIHLNRTGKQIMANKIIKEVKSYDITAQTKLICKEKPVSPSVTTTKVSNTLPENVNAISICNVNMLHKISEHRKNPSIAFAHTISSDFEEERRMTAGVAVTFARCFGKPTISDCIDSHLTYQCDKKEAGVYGLLTKPKYNGKPKNADYDIAFAQLTKDFKNKNYTHLICSPMGCVRDEIRLEHFISNLKTFQKETGAIVDIISHDVKARRRILKGLSHEEFLRQMEQLLKYQAPSKRSDEMYCTDTHTPTVVQRKSSDESLSPFNGWGSEDIKRSRTIHGTFCSFSSTSHQSPPTLNLSPEQSATSFSITTSASPRLAPGSLSFSEVICQSAVPKQSKSSSEIVSFPSCNNTPKSSQSEGISFLEN